MSMKSQTAALESLAQLAPVDLARLAGSISRPAPLAARLAMSAKPYLCPYHIMMEFMPHKGAILDIGSGNGLWLYLLCRLEKITRGLGIDTNEKKVDLANSLRKGDSLEFLTLAPLDPWPAGYFDYVSVIDVLRYVPPPGQQDFILRLRDCAVRTVIFKDLDPAAFIKRPLSTCHSLLTTRQMPHYCSPETVTRWLDQAGFKVNFKTRTDMLHLPHYILIAEKK